MAEAVTSPVSTWQTVISWVYATALYFDVAAFTMADF